MLKIHKALVAVSLAVPALLILPSSVGATTKPTPAAHLAHWWQARGNANDSVGIDNGTLLKGAGFGPGVYGPADQAFSFDGSGQGVMFNTVGGNRGRGDFTFAFAIKTAAKRYQAVWGKRPSSCDPDGHPLWDFREGHLNNGLIFLSITYKSVLYDTGSTTKVNDGEWHFIVATRHGVTVKLYVDGNLEGTTTIPATVNLVNNAPMLAGVDPCDGVDGTNPLTGELDEMMIFRTALTQPQVQALGRAVGLTG
jgi:concanavalin A-like lectin/glucanase superfamily protein